MPFKDPEARKAYQRKYAQKNREKIRQLINAWRKANPDKVLAQNTRYRKKHPDIVAAKTVRWRKKHPERYAQLTKATRIKGKARVLANKAKYRASKISRTPAWLTPVDKFEINCIYTYCTALRNCGLAYEVDHIIPLQGKSVSGLHTPENLQVLPAPVNRLKNNAYVQ